ncbi:DUF6107 family protein [Neorhizobium sp. NPDC001467]|uniref:DUF6107 family protein n=1 Tax=Neorhizobium sp. NPDC001467 TaxID=3390595 RepID=UPI003D06A6D6
MAELGTDLGAGLGNDAGVWTARALGAVAGAAVSLIYLLPENRREALSRFVTGVSCGLIFGGPAGIWLAERADIADAVSATDMMLAGSAAASLCAWWVLGALSRIASRYGRKSG